MACPLRVIISPSQTGPTLSIETIGARIEISCVIVELNPEIFEFAREDFVYKI